MDGKWKNKQKFLTIFLALLLEDKGQDEKNMLTFAFLKQFKIPQKMSNKKLQLFEMFEF